MKSLIKLPAVPNVIPEPIRSYLVRLVQAISNQDIYVVRTNTAVGSILLASPNGSVYTVRVTDAGVLETVLVYDA